MDNTQNIQWFPGHMTKTKRMIQSDIKLVNAVVEVLDARIPYASKNPDIDEMINNKKRLVVLNKCDLADPKVTETWIKYYKDKNIMAIAVDSKNGTNINKIVPSIKFLLEDEIKYKLSKGIKSYKLRIMIVGVPNAGKSSLINRLANKKAVKVEDRPGVTRGKQWVKIDKDVETLDTPGVLWPKFNDQITGEKLAFTGAVKDNVMDIELLAMRLIEFLSSNYKWSLKDRYKLNDDDLNVENTYDILSKIAKNRGMIVTGGHFNTERAAILIVDEFRSSKLGKISLEKVDSVNESI
ncbi:MAG: ribosome biogenesis GTPase YlqF [Oscillospiraceae bacterium]